MAFDWTSAAANWALTASTFLRLRPADDSDPVIAKAGANGGLAVEDVASQTTLAAILARVPALGQALAAASSPVVIAASTHVGSAALEASHVISAVPCKLRSAKAINTSAGTLYLMCFDLSALPANGTAPSRVPIPITAGDVNGDTWEGSTTFATGCVVALSSTVATLTVAGAVGWFDVEVVS